MNRRAAVFLVIFLYAPGNLQAQAPPPPAKGAPILQPQELEKMKMEVTTAGTDSTNFEKRIDFARIWITLLASGGKAEEIKKRFPPGTLVKIRQSAATSPEGAYRELDGLFRVLAKFEKPGSPAAPPPPLPAAERRTRSMELSLTNPSSHAKLWAKVYWPSGPEASRKYPAVILLNGALGFGSETGSQAVAEAVSAEGFAVGVFDPDGRGKSEGKEDWNGRIQQDGLRAFLAAVADLDFVDRNNEGIVSQSYGIALAAGTLGRYPADPNVKYLIDMEGPSDRFSITRNDSPDFLALFNNHPTTDAGWWKEREPVAWLPKIRARYLRLQSEQDHVQAGNRHAIDLVNAATDKRYGGQGRSPWTRVNGTENGINRVYSVSCPPKWLPGKGSPPLDVLLRYLKEMSGQPASP